MQLNAFVGLLVIASATAGAQGKELVLLDYHASAPAAWTPRVPGSTSRLAEFLVPQTSAGTAEIVVYFFGPQPPNVEANLTRWRGQFSNPDGSPVKETITRDSSGRFPLTFAEYEGSYRRGIGAGSTDSLRTGQRLIAAIVETPKGTLYIQLFGVAPRVAVERDAFTAFVKGIK